MEMNDLSKVLVPIAHRAAIIKALKVNNRPVTEDAIQALYLERQKRRMK